MKTTKRKASGFFIVEILIVLAIIAILVAALLPNLSTYSKRAKFADVLSSVDALKPAVELCILQTGTPNSTPTACAGGSNGVPSNNTTAAGNVAGTSVSAAGAITGSGTTAVDSATYILTPTYTSAGVITWAPTGSCTTMGLC